MKLSESKKSKQIIYTLTAESKEEKAVLKKFQNITDPTTLQYLTQNNKIKIWFNETPSNPIGGKLIEIQKIL